MPTETKFASFRSWPDTWIQKTLKGIEREALRIDPEGRIAQTPHPTTLGAPLTHPTFTTDYSEALLEIVTSPQIRLRALYDELEQLHAFAGRHLDHERLWPLSMPPPIGSESEIPIARYGTSPQGLMRHRYRVGLGHRYGRAMQVIAGIHFNFSLNPDMWTAWAQDGTARKNPDIIRNEAYLGILRNVSRYGWVLAYLFGASPALCRSFAPDSTLKITPWNTDTLYDPLATSLRMSDLGYRNKNQQKLRISQNSLDEYIKTLTCATATLDPDYRRLGVRSADGEWLQLNDHVLQIENEYYSIARPKPAKIPGQRPLVGLRKSGIEYLEIRILDVDPRHPVGVAPETLAFLEIFLWWCLIEESPPLGETERFMKEANLRLVAYEGRNTDLPLQTLSGQNNLGSFLGMLLGALEPIAERLSAATGENLYRQSVMLAQARSMNPDETPSAWVLHEMETRRMGHRDLGLDLAAKHQQILTSMTLHEATKRQLAEQGRRSIEEMKQIEAAPNQDFEAYLNQYFRPA
ncbi:MAG: glutamate--cysteine ligase [Gammaproteobacteria bacterium]